MFSFFRATARRAGVGCALAIIGCASALAQGVYPAQPVRAVLPYSAGSGPDAVMRHVGELVSREWGQQLLIDNKPGANGWLAIGEANRSKPDGHTLLVLDGTYMALQPHLYKKLPFDPVRDFEPVTGLYTTGFFIVVGANSPWKSVADLVAAAKARPGAVNYGSWGLGSVAHVGTAQFEAASGIQMMHVPFKELPQLYTAVATGEVDWAFGSAATVEPLYRAGKVKLLAYAGAKRLPGYENVPTVAESGGPSGLEVGTWVAVFAPKKTPAAVVEQIKAGIDKALAQPAVRQRMAGFGFQPWNAGSAEVARLQAADTQRYAQVVQRARIALD
jgi:tripartite-type tricarboxylate transporter receptor subunit TctC